MLSISQQKNHYYQDKWFAINTNAIQALSSAIYVVDFDSQDSNSHLVLHYSNYWNSNKKNAEQSKSCSYQRNRSEQTYGSKSEKPRTIEIQESDQTKNAVSSGQKNQIDVAREN